MFRLFRYFLAAFAVLVTTLALADPPARVGRLALVEDDVTFRLNAEDQGEPASVNWPISSGAMLDTGYRGRAEVWVGSTAFRLGAASQLEFPVVDDRQVAVRLLGGTLAVSILDREQSDDVSVQTPQGRITFAAPGRYRIDVRADHTELTAQAGQASFSDGERRLPVAAGQKARLYDGGRMRIDPDFAQDAFDNWVADRENASLTSASRRHVSPAMTGYQDLDRYGDWGSSSEYGAVWYPRAVDADWAPYRYGRWAWVAPWGWTWIDESPWGFAPFHYGRWVQDHNRWGWVPGSYVARPVYAPALVAWIGNPGWNAGFRSGARPAVGWFPLAPREVYLPGFHATAEYVRQVNQTHVRDAAVVDRAIRSGPPQPYLNRALPQAVTIVPASHLSEGRSINPAEMGRRERRELERAPAARLAPDNVVPPPVGGRQMREDQGAPTFPRGRESEARPVLPADATRQLPAGADQRPREAVAAPVFNRDDGRRGNFGREPFSAPPPVSRDSLPVRAPEVPRPDAERRAPPVPVAAPVAPAASEMLRDNREGQRREMSRPERDQPHAFDAAPRPREMPPAAPQPLRAPPPQAVPAPAPGPNVPRAEPRPPTPPAQQQRSGNGERRHDQGDEHGPR